MQKSKSIESQEHQEDDDMDAMSTGYTETELAAENIGDDQVPDGWVKSSDWVNDKSVSKCQYNGCRTKFGLHRRHHCRRCGGVFCTKHCSNKVIWSDHKLVVCDGCHLKGNS